MSSQTAKASWKFFDGSVVVSQPGSSITVRELILTDRGRKAITTSSKGIQQGATEMAGPRPKAK